MALPPPGDPRRHLEIAAIWIAGYACPQLAVPVGIIWLRSMSFNGLPTLPLRECMFLVLPYLLPGAFHVSLAVLVHFQLFLRPAFYLIFFQALLLRIGQWFVGILAVPCVLIATLTQPVDIIVLALVAVFVALSMIGGMELYYRLGIAICDRLDHAERANGPGTHPGFDPVLCPSEAQRRGVTTKGDEDAAPPTR